ncbi:MAG: LamG domain-containing protein [Bdellovibrionales bacterium]|nr:LamG domain-containing protein [Bdellovibrionales bacterium]
MRPLNALAFAALAFLLAGCTGNPLGDGKTSSELAPTYQPGIPGEPAEGQGEWSFINAADYIYDADSISITGGKAQLKTVDLVHTGTDLSGGTHVGTQYSGSALRFNGDASDISLASTWTPKFSALVGYWKMDNNWQDASGLAHHGSASGNAAFTSSAAQAVVGTHAGVFDGTGDSVTTDSFATSLPSNVFSYSAWVRPDTITTTYAIVGWSADNGPLLTLENTGLLRLSLQNGTVIATSGASKPLSGATIWHHVAATYDASGNYALYINGENVGSGTNVQTFAMGTLIIGMKGSGTTNEFKGRIDDLAVFSQALSAGDVALIYHRQKQKYSGIYTSTKFDMGGDFTWDLLKTVTSLPFGKELPAAADVEVVGDYSGGFPANLMTDLVGLWHLNEAVTGAAGEVKDSSGYNHHGTPYAIQSVSTGRFGRAMQFAANNDRIVVADVGEYDNTDKLSISAWVYPTSLTGTRGIISKRVDSTAVNSSYGIFFNSGALTIDIHTANDRFTANKVFEVGHWYHIVVVYDGALTAAQRVSVYVDGVLDKVGSETSASIPDTAADLQIGRLGGSASLIGSLDEVAIWRRALTPTDVTHLYRRGANRVKYQVRSCDDAACDTEEWMGPDGKATSFFSELHNWSAISATGEGSGSVRAAGLNLNLGDFNTAGLAIPDNRYFQYRVLLESDESQGACASGCIPDVKSVAVNPGTPYRAGNPSIANRNGVTFSEISELLISSGGTCTPTYQLSQNGSDYLYWNGSAWVTATLGTLHSNDATDLLAHLDDFANMSGPKGFYFRAYLNSDTTQSCELDSVLLKYTP